MFINRGSFKYMKTINQRNILGLIKEEQPISRVQLVEETGLSPATVSNIVKELLKSELIMETERGSSRGGRRPVLLEINPDGSCFIGLEWGIREIRAVMLNLLQDIIERRLVDVESFEPRFFKEASLSIIKELGQGSGAEKIAGVGIGVHGLVNPEKGISLYAPHFEWKQLELKKFLTGSIPSPLFIDNDVRMMARAEKWAGRDNFIFINTGPGIGAALTFNGAILTGRDWCAGEFGHMTIVEDGPRCSCGNNGCLESLISVERLVDRRVDRREDGMTQNLIREQWDNLVRGAEAGEAGPAEILEEAARYLGRGTANLVNLLNPEMIIVGGDFLDAGGIIFPPLKREVRKRALEISGEELPIIEADFGRWTGSVGAATRVMEELFQLKEGIL